MQEGFAIARVVPLTHADDRRATARFTGGQPEAVADSLRDAHPDLLPWRAVIAHELNQPLTALMIYLQTLRAAAHRSRAVADAALLDKALQEATRAAQILQRMRALVDARPPERVPLDLGAAVSAAIARVRTPGAQISIVACAPRGPTPKISADPVHIEQILFNLVRNAVEAATAHAPRNGGPRVTVRLSSGSAGAAIAVSDNGAGLTDDVMARLFRPYASTKRGGLGLGLAIARRLARLHGGDIAIDPGRAGGGATFTLLLPDDDSAFHGDRQMDHEGNSK